MSSNLVSKNKVKSECSNNESGKKKYYFGKKECVRKFRVTEIKIFREETVRKQRVKTSAKWEHVSLKRSDKKGDNW